MANRHHAGKAGGRNAHPDSPLSLRRHASDLALGKDALEYRYATPWEDANSMSIRPIPSAPLARSAMAYVLAGGRGSRLMELTDRRAKPAVFFGAKSRIIDFALSNAINSGIRRIGVATQYKAHSLIRHMQRGWNFLRPERNESFDILPASQRVSETEWYAGTADAVFQNLDIIESYGPRYMVLLAGDHVYKMDYEMMLQQHVSSGADVTVGCIEVPRLEASSFGVMHVDESDRIISFLEKPADPPSIPGRPDTALASMGIYVFEMRLLANELRRDAVQPGSNRDFGKDIIPHIVGRGGAVAHRFEDSCVRSGSEAEAYWRDVGTLDAYWQANIDLTDVVPSLDLYDRDWPIWTNGEVTPPAKFVYDDEGRRGMAVDSLVAGGCIVSGSGLRRSLLFTDVRVHSYCQIEGGVILPGVSVSRSARLRNVIVDSGVHIPEGLVVGEDPVADAARFRRTERGICLITKPMIDALGA
jgi:glucose-1-phosphate adenylyltransferase